jgi:hypothetical protein
MPVILLVMVRCVRAVSLACSVALLPLRVFEFPALFACRTTLVQTCSASSARKVLSRQ